MMAWWVLLLVQEPDASAYHQEVLRTANLERTSGEEFCRNAAPAAEDFVLAYEAFESVRWLEEGEKYYEYLLSRLGKDPDGYEGWTGATASPSVLVADSLAGDALLGAALLRFAEAVARRPELKERFGDKARRWADLARRVCWEKWNKRGCWFEEGSYRAHPRGVDPASGKWVDRPGWLLTEPLHTQCLMGVAVLRLWRLTGRDEFRDRAEKVFSRAKALWRHFPDGDRIAWGGWTPHGPYDFEGRSPRRAAGVAPDRPLDAAIEAAAFVEAFDSGLVFDAADLERLIRTNLWMSYGRRDGSPGYKAADGSSDAGAPWVALARFDEAIRKGHEKMLNASPGAGALIAYGYLKNVVERRLDGKPLHADPSNVRPSRVALQPGRHLGMALAAPSGFDPAEGTRLTAQACAAGPFKVELLDGPGKAVLGVLHTAVVAAGEYVTIRWDGANPKTGKPTPGEYRVRWTLGDESRVEAVRVKPAGRRPPVGAPFLKPGQSLSLDFEKPADPGASKGPDTRWQLEGAGVTEERARGGKASLKLSAGDVAFYPLGGDSDLPVRVTFWVYDGGATLGKKSGNGPAWGVRAADGNTFLLRTCWRPHFSGDFEYLWTSTWEGQPFAPHLTRVKRKKGWVAWTFDLAGPEPKVTADGERVGNLMPEVAPKGASGVLLLGGDAGTGDLYVDDLTIEVPKK